MSATIPGHATEIRYARTGPLAGKYYHRFGPGVRMRANADGSVTLRGRRRIHARDDEPGFWQRYGGHRANPFRSFVTRAKSAWQREGQRGINWTFDGMSRADREAFDRFLVTTQDPLAYEAGTQESRFNRYVKRNPERRCKRCGTPTVYKSGICRYCQTPAEQSTKASERGIPRRGANPSKPTHQAFCLRCLGGGKFLGRPGSKHSAEREATSHMGTYGHGVTILPARNPRRHRAAPRSRRQVVVVERETAGLPWGWIFAGVFFWTWSLNRGAVASVTAPGDTTSYVSLSDVVRGMQADADALAATAEAEGGSYVSLSDWVRSL